MSAGTIIESMSTRKISYVVGVLFVLQIACFLIGALVSPKPNSSEQVLATKCIDPEGNYHSEKWFYPRGKGNCRRLSSFEDEAAQGLTADNIVFAFQIPLPRYGIDTDFSRWQQSLMGILTLDIEYQPDEEDEKHLLLLLIAKLGYRNKGEPENVWHPIHESVVHRHLDCDIDPEERAPGFYYNCTILSLFELGSLHHDFYLLNVRLPAVFEEEGVKIDIHSDLGKLVDVWLVAIFQNGGFTKVWLSLKTIFFPVILLEMIWFYRRIQQLPRNTTLLERMLFTLGCALTFLNLPLEYFTLSFDMPWLTLFNDFKQGVFYATLLTFWLVFTGEHCVNETGETGEKNGLAAYWKRLTTIILCCLSLFIFDICERGMQLKNPFFSIWSTELGTDIALSFIIVAGISAGIFFLYLCFLVYRVLLTLKQKQSSISAMPTVRRLHYMGIVWRFRFLLLTTLVISAMTCIGFIIGRVAEGQYKWDEDISLEYTSGFMTGVYGMWNIYVFGLLFLYAPSHKNWPSQRKENESVSANGEEIEFAVREGAYSQTSELSSLTQFMKHQATD